MAISESEIAQVRAATDIVALISETVALKKSGRRWTGLCPFHGEKTPSFSVNAEEGRYYCFGCRASGDQITFVREIQHLDFMDALRLLADRAGIELHEDANAGPARKERQEALAAMEKAVAWYHDRLLNAPDARAAREYLKSRGIGGDVARQFKLGWAPDEWDGLAKGLKFTAKVLLDTGLGFVNKGDRRQDALRARIIFPIFDPGGKAIAVGGRILPPPFGAERTDGRVEAKYKNSPETAIYSKRRTLYALNWAKDDVIKSDEIIVCEGYTDVIAFFAAGLPRAVATCGTALGEEHFKTMRNFAKRIVLAYDADKAGQSAAASVYQWERQHEVDVFVAKLPKGSDPAELAQKDPEALRKSVADAVPFLRFRLDRVLESANLATAEGRGRAAEYAMDVLAEHPSELVRDQYIMQVAGTLRLEESLLRPRVAELARNPKPRIVANEPPPEAPRQPRVSRLPMPRPGLEALRLRVHFPHDVKDRLVAAYFVNDVQREIYEGLSSDRSLSEVIDDLDRRGEEEAARVLSQLAVDELDREYTVEDVTAVVSQLIRSAVTAELKNVTRDLHDGTMTPEVADVTVRDVKERLVLLESPSGHLAENELREWLVGANVVQVVVTGEVLGIIGGLEMTAPLAVDEERSLYPLIQQGRRAESRLARDTLDSTERRRLLRQRHAGQEAESKLLRATLGLVRTRVVERGYRFGNDELEAAGVEALVNALHRFDPEQGNRFSTYANYWIMKLVNQAVQQQAGLTDSEMRLILKLQKLIRVNPNKHLTKRDVAQSLGISQAKAHETMQLNRELQSRRYGTTELDDDSDFRVRREAADPPSWVIDALRRICGDDFDAFWQFTFRTMSIDEIARAHGVSRQGMTKRIARCRRLVRESSDAERLLQWFARQ